MYGSDEVANVITLDTEQEKVSFTNFTNLKIYFKFSVYYLVRRAKPRPKQSQSRPKRN